MGLATIDASLRAACRTKFITLVDADFATDRIAWEGDDDFEPSAANAYFAESFRAGPKRYMSVGNANGTGGSVLHPFDLTITLFFPKGKGTIALERCAGAVMALFRPGTVLTNSGEGAIVNNVTRSAVYQDGNRIACAVTASMNAFTQN